MGSGEERDGVVGVDYEGRVEGEEEECIEKNGGGGKGGGEVKGR